MRHYRARERRLDDRWEYTVEVNGLSYPVGYCIKLPDLKSEYLIAALGSVRSPAYLYYAKSVADHSGSFHSDGHASKEEACICYRKYILDNRLRISVAFARAPAKCQICREQTYLMATVDATRFILCDQHRNRKQIEVIMPVIYERFEI